MALLKRWCATYKQLLLKELKFKQYNSTTLAVFRRTPSPK